ncbi:glucose-1-phosphate thymidylyltransferase [Nocardiopsis mwathae]|uniref:Glucose-1-phosphate thymidylyltransferase n=1 Tax=Nocardiopsis mwathae TaxID=1472723 RepID=A0A7W9YLG6_9ACTN|nr:glucose-1-phosphate thymidylyltransferase [Nocardiopsis mwathae]MBB6174262.1 glucose-1-phosphate thymidylyltransferase [Nocardiopsis mwathae]
MKALVLSGGSGLRLRPFSHSMPKQLLPIANKPVIDHVLENIRDIGITDIGVVVGGQAPEIITALGDGSRWGTRLTYLHQKKPLGLAHCLLQAREFLGDDDFVVYLGDNMLLDGISDLASDFSADRPAAHVVLHKVSDPTTFGVAELGPDGEVSRLVEKPSYPRSNLALIGVYFFTPAIHEAVRAIGPSPRGELEITDAVQWLLDRGIRVTATEYTGYWKDVGRVEDVLECNRRVLDGLSPAVAGEVDDMSVIRGPVVIEPGARITRSVIEGPVIVGASAVLTDSHVGPHVSIGRGCILRDARLDGSMALDGAVITGVRGLHHSLIGRSARVGPSGGVTQQHRLVVGDHCQVEVAV